MNYFNDNWDYLILPIIFILLLDFIFLGLYKKNKFVARVYYPIYKITSWLTLSRFYRGIYYVFASNIKKIYLIIFFVLFIPAIILLQIAMEKYPDDQLYSKVHFYDRSKESSLFSGYYQDRNEDWESVVALIPSPILKGRFLELIVKHNIQYERYIVENCPEVEEKDLEGLSGAEKLKCLNHFFILRIDDEILDDPKWDFYFVQKQRRKSFITFLDTESLEPGKHTIEISGMVEEKEWFVARIPFFKE